MTSALRLVLFAVILAVAFTAAYGVGAAVPRQ